TECAELGQCGGDVRTPHVAAVDHTRDQTGAAQARDLGQIVDAFLVGDQVQTDRLDRGVLEHTQGAGTARPEVGRDPKCGAGGEATQVPVDALQLGPVP